MNSKIKIILFTCLIFVLLFSVFYFFGFPYKLIAAFGVLVIFMEIALLDPPQKHHEFSTHDSRQAVNNLKGFNIGITDSDNVGSDYLVEKIEKETSHNQSVERDCQH